MQPERPPLFNEVFQAFNTCILLRWCYHLHIRAGQIGSFAVAQEN